MLKFDPAIPAPAILNSQDLLARRADLFAFLRRPEPERRQRRAPINESLFFSGPLVEAVAERWRQRCAFCEREDDEKAVHHFRPIRDARQLHDPMPAKDYYTWLAFEWNNLLWVCTTCAKQKANFFPTDGYRAPFLASLAETTEQETTLLVDPVVDEPFKHIRFRLTGRCEGLSVKGRMTVRLLTLNRSQLLGARSGTLERLRLDWDKMLASAEPEDIRFLIGIDRPYAGARINVLRRLAKSVPELQHLATGPVLSFPNRLAQALPGFSPQLRSLLVDRMKALHAEDIAAQMGAEEDEPLVSRHVAPTWSQATSRPLAADRQIATIRIRNFKGLEELDLKLEPRRKEHSGAPCLMLLGENAVGKSSTLAAVALALIGARSARRLRLKPADLLRSLSLERWDQLDSPPLNVEVTFHATSTTASVHMDSRGERLEGTDDPSSVVLGYGPRRYFDRRRFVRSPSAQARVRTLFDPLEVIPYPGTWLKGLTTPQFAIVARVLREVFSLGDSDELVRDIDGRISVFDGGRTTPVERLSEGYRSVFAMVVDIVREMMDHWGSMEEAQGVVLIDEVETHLHPRWKMNVMSSLRRALPGVQFVVTTHDPLCLRGMDDGEVIVLERDETGRIVQVTDLPDVKGMRAEQLLTSNYFGLSSTVDPEAERDFAAYTTAVAAAADPDKASLTETAFNSVKELVLGDTAAEQVVQAALRRYIDDRDGGSKLRPDLRADAVDAVLKALERGPGHEQ